MKRLTRREVTAWLAPIRSSLKEMLSGEVDSIRGYPVTRLNEKDQYARIDFCIAGFVGVLERIFPSRDFSHLTVLQKKLANGTPIREVEVIDVLSMLKAIETPLIKEHRSKVISALTTEMIQIEMDSIREAA